MMFLNLTFFDNQLLVLTLCRQIYCNKLNIELICNARFCRTLLFIIMYISTALFYRSMLDTVVSHGRG